MTTLKTKNRDMGPRSLPPQAPLAGVGADFKTPVAFWGGPNDGSAGPLSLAGPEGPMGPRIAASDVSVAELPNGLVVRRYKRLAMYRTSSFDGVVRLVAELLFKVSRIGKGSVVYLNGRKMRMLLGLDVPIHPIDLNVVYVTMAKLGFETVEVSRGKAVVVSMKHPLIEKIRAAKSIDDVIQVIRRHLGE